MVLINELTVEQINAALLHLQRSKDEVVGGNKGTTIQNITISNSGGGGNNVDYSGTIKNLAANIEKNKTAIDKNTSDIAKLKSDFSNIEKSVEDTLEGLVDNGISDLSFDPLTKQLTITTNDGDTFQTTITQDIGVLSYDSATNKLILTTGEQTQEITLPYIKSSEKGSANGVATLDENGRVPYSQLPESAMEFLGQWNASTNTPHLADGTGTNGDFYIVSVGGTVNFGTAQNPRNVTFSINDRAIYEGDIAQWVRLPAGQVSSVNGQSGEVTLTANDIEYSTGVSIKAKIDANAVQADWNVSDTTSLAYIKNKPTIPASPVQSDWNVTDTTSLAYIKNKPATNLVCTCKYTSAYDFDVVLTNTCDSQTQYTWVSATCRLRFCSSTGVLTAACFCGTASNSNNFNGCSYAQACCDILMGAECCFAGNINIPKDAVLHYSFDEVPDYPDGSADVRLLNNNTYNVQSGNFQFREYRSTTFTNSNGNVVLNISANSSGSSGAYISGTYCANKIIKARIKITALNGSIDISNGKGTNGVIVARYSAVGVYEFSLLQNPNAQYDNIYITTTNANESANIEILAIYIGDGSYSTPIIDNANGQWNSISQSGIAVQGVSGKGIKQWDSRIEIGNFNLNDNFTISIWVNPENNTTGKLAHILRKDGQFILRNGTVTKAELQAIVIQNNQATVIGAGLLSANTWKNLVVIKDNLQFRVYINGTRIRQTTLTQSAIDKNNNVFYIGRYDNNNPNTRPQSYDDLLIFDRALSDTEVQALYLNKANTPKYYDINNYDIKNADTTPTQNSNALITSGAVYNAMQGKVSMADVSNGEVPVALCSGSSSVGKSTGCSLTFDPSTGTLCATCFCGTASCADHATCADHASSADVGELSWTSCGCGVCVSGSLVRLIVYQDYDCEIYKCINCFVKVVTGKSSPNGDNFTVIGAYCCTNNNQYTQVESVESCSNVAYIWTFASSCSSASDYRTFCCTCTRMQRFTNLSLLAIRGY